MKGFIFTIDALVALFVTTALLSFSFVAQKNLAQQPPPPRFSSDLAASIQEIGSVNAGEVRSIYALDAKCGFVLVRNESLSPQQVVDVCACESEESVATASMVAVSSTAQNLLVEVHSCPA